MTSFACGWVMRSEKTILMFVLALALTACGDFERGDPLPAGDDGTPTPVTDTTGGDAVRFDGDVLPVLVDNCAQCHGAGSSTGLKLTGEADTDFAVVSSFVTPGDPDASSLLQKGSGAVAHGGGGILSTGSDDSELIAAWIRAGALAAAPR